MEVSLNNVGKKFGKTWIFRNIELTLPASSRTVIQGPNGSGKSTLLQIVSGFLIADEGDITFSSSEKPVAVEKIGTHVSIAAPYLEVIDELTLKELLEFHLRFRTFLKGISVNDVIDLSGLKTSADKPVRFYSSGMKQRVRLVLAIFTDSRLLLLDEPTSNLDRKATEWYKELLLNHAGDRTVVVSSNHQEQDYPGFSRFFDLSL